MNTNDSLITIILYVYCFYYRAYRILNIFQNSDKQIVNVENVSVSSINQSPAIIKLILE